MIYKAENRAKMSENHKNFNLNEVIKFIETVDHIHNHRENNLIHTKLQKSQQQARIFSYT
jgi:hypothetical protein